MEPKELKSFEKAEAGPFFPAALDPEVFQYPSTRDAIGRGGTIESRERAQDRREAFAQRLWTTGTGTADGCKET